MRRQKNGREPLTPIRNCGCHDWSNPMNFLLEVLHYQCIFCKETLWILALLHTSLFLFIRKSVRWGWEESGAVLVRYQIPKVLDLIHESCFQQSSLRQILLRPWVLVKSSSWNRIAVLGRWLPDPRRDRRLRNATQSVPVSLRSCCVRCLSCRHSLRHVTEWKGNASRDMTVWTKLHCSDPPSRTEWTVIQLFKEKKRELSDSTEILHIFCGESSLGGIERPNWCTEFVNKNWGHHCIDHVTDFKTSEKYMLLYTAWPAILLMFNDNRNFFRNVLTGKCQKLARCTIERCLTSATRNRQWNERGVQRKSSEKLWFLAEGSRRFNFDANSKRATSTLMILRSRNTTPQNHSTRSNRILWMSAFREVERVPYIVPFALLTRSPTVSL